MITLLSSDNILKIRNLAYHFDNFLSEGSSLDVFRHKVYPFVFIKQPNKLQNIGVVQTTHYLHL